ncbi:hypothetical protein Pint_09499 [Pistacia integerrima]|uniref:Uncharacterized protein n=1 Tax=Pistacia integerrima TaxID=434235 RepID=A0ACC0XJY9_9ROSI|nr:hypothetical protein Pint_09499 [Pistacia integerrima]
MAPEVLKKESVTDKADVFSYGIVLLEIISGQSNSKHEGKEERESLLQREVIPSWWIKKLTSYDMKQFIGIFDLAMRCVDQTPDFRPKMSDVVTELEEDLSDLPIALPPFCLSSFVRAH